MENLELRRKVAEALGCEPEMRLIDREISGAIGPFLFCACQDRHNCHSEWVNGKFLVKPYETDPHAAMDALREFAKNPRRRFVIDNHFDGVNWVKIYSNPSYNLKTGVGKNDSLSLAICQAIVEAAEKLKKGG